MTSGRVLIVGGGIAGLSAAIALSRIGFKVTVLELYGKTDGASIAITNSAVYALEDLGIFDRCIAEGVAFKGTANLFSRMMDGAGKQIPIPPPPPRPDARLPASVSIYRPTLSRILTDAAVAAGAEIRMNTTVEALKNSDTGVDVTMRDGTSGHFDLVIGADGSHSRIRSMIHDASVIPHYTGTMSMRWMLKDGPEGQSGFYMLPDSSMVATTILPGGLVYLATGTTMENRHVSLAEGRELLRTVLSRYTAPFLTALRERITDDQEIICRPFEWILVPPPWHRKRVALIGDAAHSTTAHLASGGSMAIEDAVVMAQELQRADTIDAALHAFMERRIARTSMVVETSVELLRKEQAHEHPAAGGMLRARAFAALAEPY